MKRIIFIREFFRNKSYRNLTISTLSIILTGMFVFHFVEGWRWIDSLYFSVITLSTVGYGDLTPQTDPGKVFTMLYIFSGIGIIFGFINAIYQHRVSSREKVNNRQEKES